MIVRLGFLSAALLFLAACSGINTELARSWAASQTEPATIYIAGSWKSKLSNYAGGWGNAEINQTGSEFHGTLGLYTIEGKISGKKIYAIIMSGSSVYYTAILELDAQGDMVGIAIRKALPGAPAAKSAEHAPFHLVRSNYSGISTELARSWAASQAEPASINIAGFWESKLSYFAGGWGYADITQTGSEFHGTLGSYTIEGKISGKKIYAIIMSRGSVYYTAILELDAQGDMVGMAFRKALPAATAAKSTEHAPFHLVRSNANSR